MKKEKGFSLVELIVVITIIAVITAIGVVSFTGTNKKARDSKRLADLERIRMALEVVRQVGNTYPATGSEQAVLVSNYLSVWPVGPKSDTYKYIRSVTSNYAYDLYAQMETGTTIPTTQNCGAINSCNYRVQQP